MPQSWIFSFSLKVRKWGIDVHKVELSEPKVLKQPENGGTSAVGSILKGLGVKSDPKYPTPEEFVRASHGLDEQGRSPSSFVSAASLGLGSNSAPQGMPTSGVSLLQVSFWNDTLCIRDIDKVHFLIIRFDLRLTPFAKVQSKYVVHCVDVHYNKLLFKKQHSKSF